MNQSRRAARKLTLTFLLPLYNSNEGDTRGVYKAMVPFDVKSYSYEFVLQIITHSDSKAAVT